MRISTHLFRDQPIWFSLASVTKLDTKMGPRWFYQDVVLTIRFFRIHRQWSLFRYDEAHGV